uniref:EPI36 protein n=1 Tax=Paramecium tetraurelia TaxID=5888 RepID=Q3SDG7_PARTE|nr:EPI36 [Paramecium tetraurelia]
MAPPPVPSNKPIQAPPQFQQQPALFGQPQTYQPYSTLAPVQYQPINAPLAYSVASPVQPVVQQVVAPQPLLAQSYVAQPVIAQPVQQSPNIKGESRIEYIPYQKAITEYEEQEVVQYVPRERKVTEYYAVEYQTEYVPQVFQEKYTEYVPVDRYQERVEYYPVERQVVHQQVAQQPVQVVQQPVQVVQQPVQVYQQPVQAVPVTYAPQYASPIISSRVIPAYQPQYQPAPQKVQPQAPPRSNLNNNI